MDESQSKAVVYPGFRGWGGGTGAMRGTFLHWRNKKFSFFSKLEKFQKLF